MSKLKLVPPAKKTRAEEILSQSIDEFDFDEDEVIRLVGGSAANGDKNDPVVFQGAAEHTIRRMIAKYGFDRVPFTYGEFQGMQNYCARLDIASGEYIVRKELQEAWSEGGIKGWEEAEITRRYQPVASLYCAGKLDEVRAYHRQHDVMTQLGKRYHEFSED